MTDRSPLRRLLLPLVPLYRLALGVRSFSLRTGMEEVRRLSWPVISIGNLSTGGSGKTPLTIALAKALTARGLRVDVLSRGYGRKSQIAVRVNPEGMADDFGDEPLLIARSAAVPVYVAPRRYDAGLLAEAERSADARPGIHLLDDGFQHRQLARDVDILLLNRRDWRDGLLPAGNLREPLRSAFRAGVIAIPVEEPELETALRMWGWEAPIWRIVRTMETPAVSGPVAAFCGIARPDQFFEGLEDAGVKLAVRTAFPDHFAYRVRHLDSLAAAARKAGASALVTTEKDRLRLGGLTGALPETMPLKTAGLKVRIEDEDTAIDWLEDLVRRSSTAE